ncbi:MAG: IPExxxVDY family protein [Cyclobacteriaceae bacterium]|nr:IPExxxVDY family protein [Cyclobacteriaceae bacterium]MCH8514900.1 IPExxxVDY family protein [Cyclobacteriaceae bacterium]
MAQLKLDISYEFDLPIVGIVSSDREYKVAFELNRILDISLEKKENHTIDLSRNRFLKISIFIYQTEYCIFRLVKNKCIDHQGVKSPFLTPELKQYDYLLLIEDDGAGWDENAVSQSLKHSGAFELVSLIDSSVIKSKENLLF